MTISCFGLSCLKPSFILFMQKQKPEHPWIQTEELQQYLTSLFPDIVIPPLNQFAALRSHQSDQIKGHLLSLQSNQPLTNQASSLLETEALLYLHSGVVELHRKVGRLWQREIEYKEGFFSLINFRNLDSLEPQFFRLIVKTKCNLSVFPLKSPYNYQWLRENWRKNMLLAKLFYFNDSGIEIERKKTRFKEFISEFKSQTFRRDTRFLTEGVKNDKVFIIGKGEAKLCKQMKVESSKGERASNLDIVYISEGAVLGAELFLINSKPIHTIINNQAIAHGQQFEIKEEDEEEEQRERGEGEKEHSKRKKKGKSRLGKIAVTSGGYELFAPHENVSNYSVSVQSANLEVYSIPIDKLITVILERQKGNFVKLLEQTYITILRRTHEKMVGQHRKEDEKVSHRHQKANLISSKIFSANQSRAEVESEDNRGIVIRQSEVGKATEVINHLRRQEVNNNFKRNLEKRTELMNQQNKPKTDFRSKIEAILEEKLNSGSENKDTETALQITHDLAEIFRKQNEGRTEEVFITREVLDKKIILLSKRGGWESGWDMLQKEGAPIPPRKQTVRPNYLSHTSREELTFRVKQQCVGKIHEANKIKEQFMKIKSECKRCSCYDNFEQFTARKSHSTFTRTAYRTTEGWGRASKATAATDEQPLQAVYNQMRFLSERSKEKYNHNVHLMKCRSNKDKLERRKSAPIL